MRFDHYSATIHADLDEVLEALQAGGSASVRRSRGMYGFAESAEIVVDGTTVARVLHGGKNPRPHVLGQGSTSAPLADLLRRRFPDRHAVSRMDAAEDFDGPGTWSRLYEPLLALALDRGLAIDQAGDWHRGRDGRTFYVGSPRSAVRVRLYEKGLEQRVKGLDPAASADWCRLEIQVRPEGESRWIAAAGSPEDAYGYSEWTRDLAARVLGLDVARVHVKDERPRDDERALRAVAAQYAAVFQREAERLGSWDLVWAQLERRAKRELEGRQ